MTAPNTVVPVIDISGFLAGTDLVSAPQQVREAATRSGFFQIVGHGVAAGLLDAVYQKSIELAQTPPEYQQSLVSPEGHPYRGLTTNIDKSGQVRSLRVHASNFDDPTDAQRAGVAPELSDFFSPNVWPDVIAGYRTAIRSLFECTQRLGNALMRIFAVALDLPIDYFDGFVEPAASSCSINYYPPRNAPLIEHPTIIFDEHFDGGTLTILHQRGTYAGLQVKTISGEWFPVPVIEEAFVINMGELMMRWTNGLWPATRHRVIASEDPAGHRTTLTTFHLPAVDTVIEPLKTTYGPQGPQFEPVAVYDWESRFIKKAYAERTHTRPAGITQAYVKRLTEEEEIS
ncbi:MAG: 2OG-Fe(II) oxygenase family protein [Gordonia sp. (in: high G+C Gram-positive bacteria)]